MASLGEFLQIQSARAIVIHDLEDAPDADDGASAALEHFCAESLDKVGSTREKHRGKFLLSADDLKKMFVNQKPTSQQGEGFFDSSNPKKHNKILTL